MGKRLSIEKIRPKNLSEFVGQDKVKDNLRIMLEASKKGGSPMDHILLYGPPGLGKTTLAHIIARELEVNIKMTSGPAIERVGDLASILTSLSEGDIFFIDEIHRLSKPCEEVLYPAMEEYCIDVVIGKGAGARAIRLSLSPFTVIGSTTRLSLLGSPLRERFGAIFRFDFYKEDEIFLILRRVCDIHGIDYEDEALMEVARRSRGTPRVGIRLLRRALDFSCVISDGRIDKKTLLFAMDKLGVDELGLDDFDRTLLKVIDEKFGGGPVGLDTLSACTGEDPDTIMDVYEPYLIKIGFVERTPKGRVITDRAREYLRGS